MEKTEKDREKEIFKQKILLHIPDLFLQQGLLGEGERIAMKEIIGQERIRGK